MTPQLEWPEIALRLACTVLAGGLIGLDRGGHGRAAGLRTMLLVCVAASVSMIQANLLLQSSGVPGQFLRMDVMRLPLGILSGMGFIGAGAILHRRNLVEGVTTAATLWFVTVMGLCFGGGQIALGFAVLGIGLAILWILKRLERQYPCEHRARLVLASSPGSPSEAELRGLLEAAGHRVARWEVAYEKDASQRICCEIRWNALPEEIAPPPYVRALAARPDVAAASWIMQR